MLELSTLLPVLRCCKGEIWKEIKIRVEGALPTDNLKNFCYFFTEDWRIELDAEGKLEKEVIIKDSIFFLHIGTRVNTVKH